MAWSGYQIILALVMVVTGSINTISTKWADRMTAKGSDGVERGFNHPFVQACSMFLGETLCIVVFKCIYFHYWRKQDGSVDEVTLLKGSRNFNQFFLFAPAMCDMFATSIMYIGLNLTYASSFQMLRGAVIVFTGILSVMFLGRRLGAREWIGIFFIISGLSVVGLSDFITPKPGPLPPQNSTNLFSGLNNYRFGAPAGDNHTTYEIVLGDLLIIGAQLISAAQVVLEEKFVSGLDIPALQAVGWEGIFGFCVLGLLQIPFFWIIVPKPFSDNAHSSLEDVPDAFAQMANNPLIIAAITGTILSIAFFNFAGVSVTKELSATTRMVLDSVRTLTIWIVALALGWQTFHYLQIIGFSLLLTGMCLYNDILIMTAIRKIGHVIILPISYKICDLCGCRQSRNADENTEALISNPADMPSEDPPA